MTVVNVLLARILDHAEIAEPFDLGMPGEEIADLGGVLARAVHPQFDRLEAAHQHPGGVRIADTSHGVAQHAHRIHPFLRPGNAARYEVRMAADIFG